MIDLVELEARARARFPSLFRACGYDDGTDSAWLSLGMTKDARVIHELPDADWKQRLDNLTVEAGLEAIRAFVEEPLICRRIAEPRKLLRRTCKTPLTELCAGLQHPLADEGAAGQSPEGVVVPASNGLGRRRAGLANA